MSNLISHHYHISKQDRNKLNRHKSFVIWFTGLSGSGKSTIANKVESVLYKRNIRTYALDGDNIRNGINKDLNFSPDDRSENIRRIGEISKLFIEAGVVVLALLFHLIKKTGKPLKALLAKTIL